MPLTWKIITIENTWISWKIRIINIISLVIINILFINNKNTFVLFFPMVTKDTYRVQYLVMHSSDAEINKKIQSWNLSLNTWVFSI